jgi:hypothetical protein
MPIDTRVHHWQHWKEKKVIESVQYTHSILTRRRRGEATKQSLFLRFDGNLKVAAIGSCYGLSGAEDLVKGAVGNPQGAVGSTIGFDLTSSGATSDNIKTCSLSLLIMVAITKIQIEEASGLRRSGQESKNDSGGNNLHFSQERRREVLALMFSVFRSEKL